MIDPFPIDVATFDLSIRALLAREPQRRDLTDQTQIPEEATFGDQCIGPITHVPLLLAVVVVFCRYGLYPLWARRPAWLRAFANEPNVSKTAPDRTRSNGHHRSYAAVAAAGEDGAFDAKPTHKTWTVYTKSLFAISIASAIASALVAGLFDFSFPYLMPIIPSFLTAAIIAIDRPQTTPGAVFLINAGLLVTQLALLIGVPTLTTSSSTALLLFLLTVLFPLVSVGIVLVMPLRNPYAAGTEEVAGKDDVAPTEKLRSPEDNFSVWQWMTISWMGNLIQLGYNRQVHPEDVWRLPFEFQHKRLHTLFREIKGTVIGRILVANAPDLLITSSLGILESACALTQVVLLKQLLSALGAQNLRVAVAYAALALLVRLIAAQSAVFSLWFSRRCYERSRGEMITMIYEKTIRRKAFTFPGIDEDNEDGEGKDTKHQEKPGAPASMGKILNLMRNDVYEVAQRFWEFPGLFTKPMNFVLSLALIWNILGPSSLLGILVLLFAQVLNVFVIKVLLKWERARRAVTDLKLQITSQFVETIRHLRWYDWQDRWLGQIFETRATELRYRVVSNLLQKALGALNQLAAFAFPVAAFYAYTVIGGNTLSVDVAFPALNLFTMLNTSLQDLPNLVMVLLNASIAMGRIESFMAEPDKEDANYDSDKPYGKQELEIKGADFSWPGQTAENPVLRDVNLSAGPGLTVVCGKVGAGKSALLQAILGELDQYSGERNVPEEMKAYCAQTPWLQSMSIRENILFSGGFDERRYRRTLDACALLPDLKEFEGGDLSMVGENGVGLSGGQKARVALARAVYSKARILLLDDPIAALDHHTAEFVVRKLFSPGGLCEGRTVVFVTHRVDLLKPWADQMYEVFADRPSSLELHQPEELERDTSFHRRVAAVQETQAEEAATETAEAHDNASVAIPDKFIEVERRAHGGVMASVYWRYVKAGKLWLWALLILTFIIYRLFNLLYFYFLKVWGEAYKQDPVEPSRSMASIMAHTSLNAQGLSMAQVSDRSGWIDFDFGLPAPEEDVTPWLFWFFMLSIAQFLAQLMSDLTLVAIVYAAGKRLFQDVMWRVSAATFRFYDVTPVGRLMNRLTSDIGTIDGQIAGQLYMVAFHMVAWFSSVAVIATTTPIFLGLALAMTLLFVYIFSRFLPLSQSLRRLEMVSLSPLMSNFGTLLEGLTTVRAFRAQPHFEHRIIVTTDAFQQMDHFYWSLQSWLTYRFDTLSALSTFVLTITAMTSGLSSGAVAFVLAAAATFVDTTHLLCRKYGELQMMFVSVERVIELLDLETEPQFDKPITAHGSTWPAASDDIVFDNATFRYAPRLEPSLRGVSFRIPAGSTVAVTGRTGSGKSTLALALLGTILPDSVLAQLHQEQVGESNEETPLLVPTLDSSGGSVWIGDVDIGRTDKHTLRKRISFVAQDPVLFPGTLRENLDPLREYDDAECATVLARVMGPSSTAGSFSTSTTPSEQQQQDATASSSGTATPSKQQFHLGTRVDGGGKNLSQGQRQLVGIARAVLRRSPIVILDEATASIDFDTAFRIQEVLREELRQSTVIAIAHRAEAVKDADFRIELEKGRVVVAERIVR